MPGTIDFYFDFSSSYSYIGQHRLRILAEEFGHNICWKPIALGAIFKAMNHAPPAGKSTKGKYIWHDVERSAAECDLPYHWPDPFPFNSMSAARIFWYLSDEDQQQSIDWALAVFHASFGEGRDCSNPEVLSTLAAECNLDGQALLAATKEDVIKQKLQRVTGEAMDRGVFGAPTFFLGDEMYWGADRFDQMKHRIGLK